MSFTRRATMLLTLGAIALSTAACGSKPLMNTRAMLPAGYTSQGLLTAAEPIETEAIPPASAFKTIEVKVTKILPEDNTGLPHQNFMVVMGNGTVLSVNHNTQHGERIAELKVGLTLTIKGVMYKNGSKQGIHWTHHANVPNDAGFIQTANHTYQ